MKTKILKIFLPVLILTSSLLACRNSSTLKVSEKQSEKVSSPVIDTITDDIVSFISGVPGSENECYNRVKKLTGWNKYSEGLDSLFSYEDTLRIRKMKKWLDSILVKDQNIKTVFYPFSGPDFLWANIIYPDADKYIMIGLEPVGSLPDICNLIPDSVQSYLNSVNNSMRDIFKRSYFITKNMDKDLSKAKVNGITPLLSLFIKRTGHQIKSLERIGIDTTGRLQPYDSLFKLKNVVPGLKIKFLNLPENRTQEVYYFRADISNKGMKKTPGLPVYLSSLPQSHTFLKAASFLMHSAGFSMIRSEIFRLSTTILQDDSGIAYRDFDKLTWSINLFGKYSKPKNEFSYIKEPELEEAFKKPGVKPLNFSLGYNWGTNHTSILYAVRK